MEFVPPFWLVTNMLVKGRQPSVAVLISSIELTWGQRNY